MSEQTKRAYDRESYILVVDDDSTLLKFFKIHLNKFFSKVIVVKNAKEAVDCLKEKEIDLVLTDVRMPKVTGLQLMKRVRKHDPSIPVLIVSGALLTDEQMETISDSDGFLRKPFSVDELHAFMNKGMDLRAQYKKIGTLLPDKKHLRDLLSGKSDVARLIKDAAHRDDAEKALAEIKRVS